MNDPRFAVPPSTRRFYPPWPKRLALLALGLAATGVRVLTLPRRWRARSVAGTPERIVVLEPYGMGDVVALQPLVRAWCEAGHRVVAGVRAEWQSILVPHANLTCFDLRPAWARTDGQAKRAGGLAGPDGLAAWARRLAPLARGARGVDVRGDVRSVLLLYMAGCGRVETLARYFAANDSPVLPGVARRRPVDRTVERWRLNGVFAADEGLALSPPSVDHLWDVPRGRPESAGAGEGAPGASAAAETEAAPMRSATGTVSLPALRIGLVPLTPWVGKRWLPEAWRDVSEGVRRRGFDPVLLCGPGEGAAAVEAAGADPPAGVVCAVAGGHARKPNGGFSKASGDAPLGDPRPGALEPAEADGVRAWVAALGRCAAVVCVNTGPMHLAAALGVPLVVVEGSSRLPLWAPASAVSLVVHHQDVAGCAPCHQAGLAADCARRCMALVRPGEVLAALDALLSDRLRHPVAAPPKNGLP